MHAHRTMDADASRAILAQMREDSKNANMVTVRLDDNGGPFQGYTLKIPTNIFDTRATLVRALVDELCVQITASTGKNVEAREKLMNEATTILFHFCDGYTPIDNVVRLATNCSCNRLFAAR